MSEDHFILQEIIYSVTVEIKGFLHRNKLPHEANKIWTWKLLQLSQGECASRCLQKILWDAGAHVKFYLCAYFQSN